MRLQAKYKKIAENEVRYEAKNMEDADIILVAYGSMARVCESAMKMAREEGIKVGMIRPITLWPFPTKEVRDVFAQESVKAGLTVEISNGQMVEDIRLAVNGLKPVEYMGKGGSIIPTAEDIAERIMQMRRA
jgi:2-oxoglutarate ferredoxin oxidoreductase subunit alpha